MKIQAFIDESKVEKVPYEIEVHFQKNSELFFEREIRNNLKDKEIYCDESIVFLDRFIKEIARNEPDDKKMFYSILIGSYVGQYVISKFKGNWVLDKATKNTSPMDCFIRYTKDSDLYFSPFASTINRIEYCKKAPFLSEISIIKNAIREDKEIKARIFKNR